MSVERKGRVDPWFIVAALAICVTPSSSLGRQTEDIRWDLVPLRTAAQKARGIGGEFGQMPFTLAICQQDPDCMAMGLDTAAVYVSEDGGNHWELRRRGIHSNGVQSVAFDPVNKNVMWAAGLRSAAGTRRSFPPDPKYYDSKADGIYRSDNLGKTWKQLRTGVFLRGQAQNQYFAFDPKGGLRRAQSSRTPAGCRVVYAVTHDAGLLRTTDGGKTWGAVGPKGIIANAVIRHRATGWMWLAAEEGLWLSSDDARTWSKIKTPAVAVKGIVVHPTDPKIVYVAPGNSDIWRTADAGDSWERRTNGLLSRNRWVRLAMSPVKPETLYVDAYMSRGRCPYYTHNGGKSWRGYEASEQAFNGARGGYWGEGLVAHPRKALVAYDLSYMRMTTDGGRTWRIHGSGVSGFRRLDRTSIAFRPDDPGKMLFFHGDHGACLTEDGGDTWAYVPAPRQADIGAITMPGGAYDPTPGSRRIVSAVGGWYKQRLCLSEDDGKTWKVLRDREGNYRSFAWHPQDPNVVYAESLRSDDAGETWKPIGRPVRAMFPADGDIIYTVTGRRVLRSRDRGETWEPLGRELPSKSVSEIDVDPDNPDRLYAAAKGGGIWIYDGRSWTSRGEADGLERDFFGGMYFQYIAVDPRRPNVIYAGQNHCWRGAARGIFRSADHGRTWRNINGNLGPELTVWAITVSPHDSTVWLGTDYGNWRLVRP